MPAFCSRREFIAGLALVASVPRAMAQAAPAYPTRPIQLIVPYPAGGAVDLTARLVAESLRQQFGQTVVVENRPGANGMVGAAGVARAAPDGYTLLMAPREVFGINPILLPQHALDWRKDFTYAGIVATGPYVLVVNPGLNVKTLAELVALARTRELAYASFGKGSMAHLNIEALCRGFGLKMTHVPYRGAPPAVMAVATGEVALTIATPPAALSLMQDGRVRAIAVGGAKRLPQLPDVPTTTELGVAGDPLISNYFGLAAPAGTPAAIIDKLAAETARALASPDASAKLQANGLIPASGSPKAMTDSVAGDIEHFGRLIRELDIKIE
ncbi:Bug family tripartite tricarboxylate transporter substrate binding protein [Bosea sp. (in: a-proteobacteria)]|jgi:tripartite-type tricarboxylate transporter receptor subunit TctC|uniref:Bug family tripartite tricarboxylate transporter substrate binding protein n=1 Tax=Bosea sp. (in: a-proteobacteria) TaxID=1871050 RepID=UPI003F6F35F0